MFEGEILVLHTAIKNVRWGEDGVTNIFSYSKSALQVLTASKTYNPLDNLARADIMNIAAEGRKKLFAHFYSTSRLKLVLFVQRYSTTFTGLTRGFGVATCGASRKSLSFGLRALADSNNRLVLALAEGLRDGLPDQPFFRFFNVFSFRGELVRGPLSEALSRHPQFAERLTMFNLQIGLPAKGHTSDNRGVKKEPSSGVGSDGIR
ncbi:hypothetical protein EVAR_70431_1 [Eumeta japonica]|uniref:Uncharacterized protein n=1 Tax=Eumeta variegata TaxID=151549 RepID=A0A4C2AGM9_EUMVA|nr:hypothetical protein EVAR_70431_1 [Eumeta japonica]